MNIPRHTTRPIKCLWTGTSRRGISNINNVKPQAYLRPLVDSGAGAGEEFEGVMCLVMDRKEAKNALSVQMVGVGLLTHYDFRTKENGTDEVGNERSDI
jgi:hypothetical protein